MYYQRALEIYEENFGLSDVNVAKTKNNLVCVTCRFPQTSLTNFPFFRARLEMTIGQRGEITVDGRTVDQS